MAKFVIVVDEGRSSCYRCPLKDTLACRKLDHDYCELYDFSRIQAIYKEED